jgi:hypothetical protein
MSRVGTLCGVFGVVLISLGMTQVGSCFGTRPVACTAATAAADCASDHLCTTGTCGADGFCVFADVECLTGQECDTADGGCKTPCDAATAATDCDDLNACTDDACTDGFCASTNDDTNTCDDDDACTENDACAEGVCAGTALVCDDGLFCNGTETCDVATGCVAGTAPCVAVTESCNEDTDACDTVCTDDAGCDDGVFCNGAETCDLTDPANGVCAASTDPCVDNGVFCDGTESCDEATAACVSSGDPCAAAGTTCDEATAACLTEVACTLDTDCDDGLFCNGLETCDLTDPANGVCADGTRPCADTIADGTVGACGDEGVTQTCAEGDAAAVCTACPGVTIDFTLSQDNLSGTAGDDTFTAPLLFAEGAGAQRDSFQTGDKANGLAGTDTLNATLTQGANPVVQLTGIENINFTNFAAEAINASNITGVTKIGWVDSTANLTVNTLASKVDAEISGMATAGTTFSLSFQAGATTSPTTGSSDAITLDVSDTTTGTFNVTTAANGFESMSVDSTGGNANALTAITQTTGTTMATMTFTGDTALTVNTIPNTVLTIVATSMSGALQLGTGTTAADYVGFASVANNLTDLDTGSGGDTIIFGTQFNTNDFASATVDLGAGTDIVEAIFAADYGTSMPFRNVEEFRFNCTTAATVNMTGITGLATLTNDADGAATAITMQNIPATSSVFPQLNYRGNGTQAAQTYDTVTYAATGATGSSDTLNINVANRATSLNSGTATTNVHTIGAITAAGFETVNVDVADGPATFGGITASTLVNFDADASSNLTLGTVTPTAATLVTIDCSGVTGNLSATFDWVGSGASLTTAAGNDTVTIGVNSTATTMSVTLGAGNDTFYGDTNTDCAETISAGAGSDFIQAEGGNATITTGDGADIVIYNQTTANDRSDISDFTAGAGGDIMRFDISSLALLNAGAEVTGAIAALTNATDIFLLTGAGYATDALAETAIAGDNDAADTLVFIYWNTGDLSTHILYDAVAETDATPVVLIGKLTNITTQAMHDALTIAANIDSQP